MQDVAIPVVSRTVQFLNTFSVLGDHTRHGYKSLLVAGYACSCG